MSTEIQGFKIPTTIDSFMKIGGSMSALFSIAMNIYGMDQTKKYRREVLTKLNSIIAGQKLIQDNINVLRDEIEINDLEEKANMIDFDKAYPNFKKLIYKFESADEIPTDDFNNYINDFVTSTKATESYYYCLMLENFLDVLYLGYINPKEIPDLSTTKKPLADLIYDQFRVKSALGELKTTVAQANYYYHVRILSYLAYALIMMKHAQDAPGLKPTQKKQAKDKYEEMWKKWFVEDPGSTSPRLEQIMNKIESHQLHLGEKDVWWGPELKYDESAKLDNRGINRFCIDWANAEVDEVVVGWELCKGGVGHGNDALGAKVMVAKLTPEGHIDNSTIRSVSPSFTNHIHCNDFAEASNTSRDKKSWCLQEIDPPYPKKVNFNNGEEAIIYWVISGIALYPAYKYQYSSDTDEYYGDYYIVPNVIMKPLILFKGRYYLGREYEGIENIYSTKTKEVTNVIDKALLIGCDGPLINFGGPNQSSVYQAPLTGVRFGIPGKSKTEGMDRGVICAQSKMDFHTQEIGGSFPYTVKVNVGADLSHFFTADRQQLNEANIDDFVKTVLDQSPINVKCRPYAKITLYAEDHYEGNSLTLTDSAFRLGNYNYGIEDEVSSFIVHKGTWTLYEDNPFRGNSVKRGVGKYTYKADTDKGDTAMGIANDEISSLEQY